MLEKLVAAIKRPFHAVPSAKPVALADASRTGAPAHAFQFHCQCDTCQAEISRLTLIRLKRQAP